MSILSSRLSISFPLLPRALRPPGSHGHRRSQILPLLRAPREEAVKASVVPSHLKSGEKRVPPGAGRSPRLTTESNWKRLRIQLTPLWSDLLKVTRHLVGRKPLQPRGPHSAQRSAHHFLPPLTPRSQLGIKEGPITKLSLFPSKPSFSSVSIFLLRKFSSIYK